MTLFEPVAESSGSKSFVWRQRALLAFCLITLLLAIFDKYTQTIRIPVIWCMIVACLALETKGRKHLPLKHFWGHLLWTCSIFVITLIAAEVVRLAADRIAEPAVLLMNDRDEKNHVSFAAAWSSCIKFHGYAVWLLIVWLYLPILLPAGQRKLFASDHWINKPLFQNQWALAHLRLLWVFIWGCFCMSLASMRPDRSFLYFTTEIGIYAPLFILLLSQGAVLPSLRREIRRHGRAILLAVTIISCVIGLLYAIGDESLRHGIEKERIEEAAPVLHEGAEWRLQFPFGHHNRLAYFSMIAALVFGTSAARTRGRTRRFLCLGTALGTLNILMTLNRGALLALIAGAFVYLVLCVGPRALWLLLLLPIMYLLLPSMQRERLHSIVLEKTYKYKYSTVVHRFSHWQAALIMIRDQPLTGIGYSWKHFQKYYDEFTKFELDRDTDEQVHAHNLWLQVAAEAGIPLALVFFLWHLCRWRLMFHLWRARNRLPPALVNQLALWICIELMIQLFCLINLPVRRSLGLITYGLWAIMFLDLLRMRQWLLWHRAEKLE